MEQADRYKSQGNAALQAGQFSEAIDLYTKAIGLDPSNAVYFSNRAAAYASLKRWQSALDDSHEVVTLKPEWVKGWIRRGAAFTGLGKHEEARKAYLKASQLEPSNTQVDEYLRAAEKAVAESKEKKWEDDLWSDDDDDAPAKSNGQGDGGGRGGAPAASSAAPKRAPPAADDDGGRAPKRARRKPGVGLTAQLDRSLKDASEDSLRACLGQVALADEEMAERVLHILEGLNAASSAGEDDDEDDGGGRAGGSTASWLDGGVGGGSSARRGRGRDSDSD